MFQKVGIFIGILGAMAADSTSILAPLSLIALGIGLYIIGSRLEARR